jgi:ketosteroid isomerase-like protein
MPEQENVQLIRRAYENYKTGDLQAVLGAFAESVEWIQPQVEGISFSGKRRGRNQVAEFFATMSDAQAPIRFEPQEYIAQGDRVVALGHYRWHAKATGREWESDWAHVYTIRDGQVTRFQEYTDTALAAVAYRAS